MEAFSEEREIRAEAEAEDGQATTVVETNRAITVEVAAEAGEARAAVVSVDYSAEESQAVEEGVSEASLVARETKGAAVVEEEEDQATTVGETNLATMEVEAAAGVEREPEDSVVFLAVVSQEEAEAAAASSVD